jgi:hypothetical protein
MTPYHPWVEGAGGEGYEGKNHCTRVMNWLLDNIPACLAVLKAVTKCPTRSLRWAASSHKASRGSKGSRDWGKDLMKFAFVCTTQGGGAAKEGVGVTGREPIDTLSSLLGGITLETGATSGVNWAQGASDVVGTGERAGGADIRFNVAGCPFRLAQLRFL